MFKKFFGWTSGYKTYLAATVGILSELLKAIEAQDISAVDWQMMVLYFGMIFGRQAVKKIEKNGAL